MQNVFSLIAKVSACLSKEGVGKGRRNKEQGYNFRGIDDILNTLSGVLAEVGLVILPRIKSRQVTERQTANGKPLFAVVVEAEFDLVSPDDGSKHTVAVFGEAMDMADKATNKAMSAAYKYMALMTFCIPVEATPENEADFSSPELAPAPQAPTGLDPIIKRKALDSIKKARTLEDLKSHFESAYQAARDAGDREAADQFTQAKDIRKKALMPKAPPTDEGATGEGAQDAEAQA